MDGTRDRILTATNELFRRHGYNGTSLKQVSEASTATIGSIYHFFPGGKEELGAESVRTSGAAYLDLFRLIAGEADDSVAAIGDFFAGAAAVFAETDYLEICPIGTVAREMASTSEPIRIAAHEVFETWIEAARTMFERDGLPPESARDLAVTVVAALEGAFLLCRAARDVEPVLAAGRIMRALVQQVLSDPQAVVRR